MEIKEAMELLDNITAYDVDSSKRGDRKREALHMAISALEKQEEIKIHNDRCPSCGSNNIEIWYDLGNRPTKFSFCPDCGQKFDW